ncbi:hypothetical protein M5E89_11370 [Acidaminococcus intestini]|nr:hypothetical protein M5E89_11370 [Acidaminococcus intestini]
MKNDASKSDDILVLRLRKDKKGWKLEEIMNLKWYYTKILKGEGMTKKKTPPPQERTPPSMKPSKTRLPKKSQKPKSS